LATVAACGDEGKTDKLRVDTATRVGSCIGWLNAAVGGDDAAEPIILAAVASVGRRRVGVGALGGIGRIIPSAGFALLIRWHEGQE
jgi:hypothetical protein